MEGVLKTGESAFSFLISHFKEQSSSQRIIIMFLICLLSIALIAVVISTLEQPSTTEQEELIPIPVRASEDKNIGRLG